jgi:hypothetical protein
MLFYDFSQFSFFRYDLKPLAAHNLALIYEASGNLLLARALIVKHCVCE